jgi:alkylhydroperoxidase family enzyme
MRIPPWTREAAVREPELVDAILARRGGKLINLDRALLWSEPLARAWNVFLGAVRRELAIDPRLREIAICTVARATGAEYEFNHHWPEYVRAGGYDRLRDRLADVDAAVGDEVFTDDERLIMRYALACTREVKVPGALFDQLKARFSTTEIVELTGAIATYNMVARFLVALEVEDERK